MALDPGIFLAALGITTLEIVEAAAVGVALYAESRRPEVFLAVSLGAAAVFAPMFVVGAAIALLPDFSQAHRRGPPALLRAETGEER